MAAIGGIRQSVNGIFFSQSEKLTDWETSFKVVALKVASYLTEPACKVREYAYTFYILEETCEGSWEKTGKAAFLAIGLVSNAFLAPFTVPLGIALRWAVVSLQSKPYLYVARAREGKQLPDYREITLASHNQCYMPAGYSITDGQVTPPSYQNRMQRNIDLLKHLKPDIICLYEVPDICDASFLSKELSDYPFLIPAAGVRAAGPSSMMYVASRYEIVSDSIEFLPFIKGEELTGWARFSKKGFLSFDIKSRGDEQPFATVILTHLQHSEIPKEPEESDRIAREAQMRKIAKQVEVKVGLGRNVIFTGDLNQEEDELEACLQNNQIMGLKRDDSIKGKPTWGGDEWCSKIVNRPSSSPLVLDYTFIAGRATNIATTIIETGFCNSEFRPEALSDHYLLSSTITIG